MMMKTIKVMTIEVIKNVCILYCNCIIQIQESFNISVPILDCSGPLRPEVVQSTAYTSDFPASSVLILAEEDAYVGYNNGYFNFWLAEYQKTIGQGFTIKLDDCARMIAGFQIKNLGNGSSVYATKHYKISGSMNETGPWETLVEYQLVDTTGGKTAPLLEFTFQELVEIQFIRFDLITYWGFGGGLQYFAAIPAKSRKH